MINLQPLIDRIKALLTEDSDASVTYAALEARMALEKVVYDRLRQRHDYISHDQLRAWTPGEVVKRLIVDVDEHMTQTLVLSMSRAPHVPGTKPADEDWVKIGTEVGFDAKKIARLWQALSNLALHVRIPKHKNDNVPEYGDKTAIRSKVEKVVAELERLATGTMTFSGIPVGGDVSFVCTCGEKNKRRRKLLTTGQHVFCINPKCIETWQVEIDGDDVSFENVHVDVPCRLCGALNHIPWRMVTGMKYDETLKYPCCECRGSNLVRWNLMHAAQQPSLEDGLSEGRAESG